MKGIGPWTAGYLAMFGLGDTDILLTGDVGMRAGARQLGLATIPDLLAFAEQFRPWRSYLGMHLWKLASQPPA